MLRIYLYSFGHKIIIPTIETTSAGVCREVGPVAVFELANAHEWKKYAIEILTNGNILSDADDNPYETPGSAVLDLLRLQRWRDFEMNAVMYTIHKGAMFITFYGTGRDKDRMWSKDGTIRRFAGQAPLELVMEELAIELAKEPEAHDKPTTLLLGGPTLE